MPEGAAEFAQIPGHLAGRARMAAVAASGGNVWASVKA